MNPKAPGRSEPQGTMAKRAKATQGSTQERDWDESGKGNAEVLPRHPRLPRPSAMIKVGGLRPNADRYY